MEILEIKPEYTTLNEINCKMKETKKIINEFEERTMNKN